jgi:hypothetical protein
MTVVLPFPHHLVSPTEQGAMTQPAEIIIFPGVRFERGSSDPAPSLSPPRKRRASQAAIDEFPST